MNRRDPTATPSVMLPSLTAEVLAKLRTSPIFPLRRCCIQVVHIADDLCFQWGPLRSDSDIGNVEVVQKGQHQDWVTHDVTVVTVPLIRQASVLLQRVLRIMGTGVFSGHPSWKFADSCNLAAWSVCNHCSSAESFTPIQGRGPPLAGQRCFLSSRLCCHHSKGLAALQVAVNVSFFCASILRHWQEPFLFTYVPTLLLQCALGGTATPPRALPSTRSSKKQFFHRL